MSTDFPQTLASPSSTTVTRDIPVFSPIAIARGAGRVSGTEVRAMDIYEADKNWDVLHESDAIVFGDADVHRICRGRVQGLHRKAERAHLA